MMVSWWEIYVSIFHEKRKRNIEEKKKNMKRKFEHDRNDKKKISWHFVKCINFNRD